MWRVDRLSAHHRCDVILSAAEGETRRMSLPLRRIAPILLMSLVAAIAAPLTATAAGASPIDDKKAEAARLAAAIEANGEKTTALDEQMNGAQIQLQDAQTQIATAKQGIDQAQQQADSLKAALGQRAASIYTDQTSPGANADSLADPITAAARSTYAAAAANKNDGMISQLTVVKEQLAQKKAEYEAAGPRPRRRPTNSRLPGPRSRHSTPTRPSSSPRPRASSPPWWPPTRSAVTTPHGPRHSPRSSGLQPGAPAPALRRAVAGRCPTRPTRSCPPTSQLRRPVRPRP
jgi:hypothetical protein